jgi:hypothetical protein
MKVDPITQKVPMVDFADMDRSGMFDMVFFMQKKIYTLFNKQKAMSDTSSDLCRKEASNESLANYKIFDTIPLHESSDYDQDYVNRQTVENVPIYNSLQNSAETIPGRVRIGDIDADGYPDIVITLTELEHVINSEGKYVPVL